MHATQPVTGTAPLARLSRAITGAYGMSITALVKAARLVIFASPVVMTLAQAAQAQTVVETWEEDASPACAAGLAAYGPFTVASTSEAQMCGETDSDSPGEFRRMLAAYPAIRTLRLVDVAGTHDDDANFALARMIRRAGIETVVPEGGSVRSGGVELFLAGVRRSAAPGAEFGVHSWQSMDGTDARDATAADPAHAQYIRYYQEVGFSPEQAKEFYAFTNRVAFHDVHYMTAEELRRFAIVN